MCLICYIVYAKYQIAPLKAVVGVDQPMKAPSMHIKSLIREKLSKFSQLSACHFVKNYFFLTKLLHAYVQCVYIV